MDRLSDDDHYVIAVATNAMVDSETPLSTIEVWHAIYSDTKVAYGRLRRLLKHAVNNPKEFGIRCKQQMRGHGRRDYYLREDVRNELLEIKREVMSA